MAINAQSICQLNVFDQVENIFEHSQNILKDNEFYPKDWLETKIQNECPFLNGLSHLEKDICFKSVFILDPRVKVSLNLKVGWLKMKGFGSMEAFMVQGQVLLFQLGSLASSMEFHGCF